MKLHSDNSSNFNPLPGTLGNVDQHIAEPSTVRTKLITVRSPVAEDSPLQTCMVMHSPAPSTRALTVILFPHAS